jgi:septum formation protein
VAQTPSTDRPRGELSPVVLASASPRRRELLAALGASFEAIATDAEEGDEPAPATILARLPALPIPAANHPTLLAWRKAAAAAALAPGRVVLGADTTVALGGEVLNKPRDAADAHAMLRRLAGRRHTVYTGLCLLAPAHTMLEIVATEVEFFALDDATIAAYVATGEPLDKAGAYGVQGRGGELVREVRGSYTNVVGLPLVAAHHMLSSAAVGGLSDPAITYERWLRSQGKEPLPCPPTLP